MSGIEDNIHHLLETHLKAIQQNIATRMAQKKRNASGKSVASLAVVFDALTEGHIEGGEQWKSMQRGRGGGKGPYNFRDIIKDWIIKKGISITQRSNQSRETALNSAAYLISRSILKHGTALKRKQGYDDIYDTVIQEELALLEKDAGLLFETETDVLNDKW